MVCVATWNILLSVEIFLFFLVETRRLTFFFCSFELVCWLAYFEFVIMRCFLCSESLNLNDVRHFPMQLSNANDFMIII